MQQPVAEKQSGWIEEFDRLEPENHRAEKPVNVLNSRQVEYNAHIKRLQQKEAQRVG